MFNVVFHIWGMLVCYSWRALEATNVCTKFHNIQSFFSYFSLDQSDPTWSVLSFTKLWWLLLSRAKSAQRPSVVTYISWLSSTTQKKWSPSWLWDRLSQACPIGNFHGCQTEKVKLFIWTQVTSWSRQCESRTVKAAVMQRSFIFEHLVL